MPVGEKNTWNKAQFISAEEIKIRLAELGTLTPFRKSYGKGPARMYELKSPEGKIGAVGFISPINHHFCDQCNRLRLTSEGKLRSCLLNDDETDLKSLMRGGGSDQEIIASIKNIILNKPQGHTLQQDFPADERTFCSGRMSRIGG